MIGADINLKGASHMIRACYRDFSPRKRYGKIINISLHCGLVGNIRPGQLCCLQSGTDRPFQIGGYGELGSRGVRLQLYRPRLYRNGDDHDIKEDNPSRSRCP